MTWDITSPAGSDNISLGDNVIREFKSDIADALSDDGVFPGTDPVNPTYHWTGQRGATAGRPSSPETGQLYFNTQLFQLEYYTGSAWTAYDLVPLLGIITSKINDLAVTTGKINDLAVTTGKINDLAVTTGKINDLGVTTGKIAALAVTDAKVNDVAASKITGTLGTANGGTGTTTSLIKRVSYTGNGGTQNVAHGVGAVPDIVIIIYTGALNLIPHIWVNGITNGRDFDGISRSTGITSVDSTNIALGAFITVNESGTPYMAICIKAN
jgi:hypothetical protein